MLLDSASRCPLARELMQRLTHGDFYRARDLLRGILNGVESVSGLIIWDCFVKRHLRLSVIDLKATTAFQFCIIDG